MKRSDNTISVNIKLPSLWIQISSPSQATPTEATLLIDPSIVTEIAIAWKLPIANVTKAVKSLLRNKFMRDRRLLFALLNSGLEMSCQTKVCDKPYSPYNNYFDWCKCLRLCVFYNYCNISITVFKNS